MKCTQNTCDAAATVTYEWPGWGRCYSCPEHVAMVQNVSSALGCPICTYPIVALVYEPLLCLPCWAYLRIYGHRLGEAGLEPALANIVEWCAQCGPALRKRQA